MSTAHPTEIRYTMLRIGYKKTLCYCLFLCTIVALASCSGWRIRGNDGGLTTLSENSIYLSGPSSETYRRIESQLKKKNIITSFTIAKQQLILGDEKVERRSASLNRGASTAEYELILTIPYKIIDSARQITLREAEARAVRSYTFDENDIAGKNKEEELIRRDIQNIAARQILQQLELTQR
ncbi:MAG: LPS-assembly lipoprotein [Cellvibrionaceae bacterium]|jgi:LPS-assembly lipoprotein